MNTQRLHLLLLLLCLPAALSEANRLKKLFRLPETAKRAALYRRIPAPQGRFPFYVSFRRTIADDHFCSGTLISPNWILTSASCMDPEYSGNLVRNATAHVGIFDLNPKKSRKEICKADLFLEIDRIEIPIGYGNGRDGGLPYDPRYDIALVKLKKPSRQPWALLPLESWKGGRKEDLLNVGLGRSERQGAFSRRLEMAVFPSVPSGRCLEELRNLTDASLTEGSNKIPSDLILCVDGKGQYCQLDIGSSLIQYRGPNNPPVVVGFASRITQECSLGRPYTFSDIAFHLDWIMSVEGILEDMIQSDRPRTCRSNKDISKRLTHGAEALPGRYPYAVGIRTNIHLCQGVLIAPRYVLTAGSCLPPEDFASDPSKITAYIGGLAIEPAEEEGEHEVVPVKRLIYHRRFDRARGRVDLVIVVLRRSSKMTPIRLPVRSRSCCRDGLPLRIFSWGSRTEAGSNAPYLQTGIVRYFNKTICRSKGLDLSLHRKTFCVGSESFGAGLCRGDIGAPVFLSLGLGQDILVGVGYDIAADCGNRPTPFLKIGKVIRWLRRRIPEIRE